jgi:hypothetical protein
MIEDEIIREWSIEMQRRPRDNHILRRGLFSGAWVDLVDLLSSRDASIVDVVLGDGGLSLYSCKACQPLVLPSTGSHPCTPVSLELFYDWNTGIGGGKTVSTEQVR